MLCLILTSFRFDRTGARVEFAGGHVLEYRRIAAPAPLPSLPPPTFTVSGEAVEETPAPSVAKARPRLSIVRAA